MALPRSETSLRKKALWWTARTWSNAAEQSVSGEAPILDISAACTGPLGPPTVNVPPVCHVQLVPQVSAGYSVCVRVS